MLLPWRCQLRLLVQICQRGTGVEHMAWNSVFVASPLRKGVEGRNLVKNSELGSELVDNGEKNAANEREDRPSYIVGKPK